jgi:hypothetical protein
VGDSSFSGTFHLSQKIRQSSHFWGIAQKQKKKKTRSQSRTESSFGNLFYDLTPSGWAIIITSRDSMQCSYIVVLIGFSSFLTAANCHYSTAHNHGKFLIALPSLPPSAYDSI